MASRTMTAITSHEEPPTAGLSSGRSNCDREDLRHRRRHSSCHTREKLAEQENVPLLVNRFLAELERRLHFLETYGEKFRLDNGIERAYSTLHAVRESCSHVSDEVIGAGRRRAKIMVDTLEERYKGALAKKETMEQKVHEGVRMMDTILADFEARAYAMRDSHLHTANELFDSGIERAKEVMDDGLIRARLAKDALRAKVDGAVQKARQHGLIAFRDLPEPWKVNPFIVKGYRFSETKVECVRSIFGFSNELVNIWSHLVGLMVVLSIAFYFYPMSPTFSLSTKADIVVAAVFFIAACKCLVCSTLWHTMSSISNRQLMERFACVDYSGISMLVASSIATTEYTAFYCEPLSRNLYLSLTMGLGVGGTILPWHPTFNRADMAWFRVAFYVTLAATGFVPIAQLSFTKGFAWAAYFYAPILKSISVYLGGACLYAGKVPERFYPGAFDYVGGSHNIWHFAVLGGILFHYSAMQKFFAKAFGESTCT
ncbi:MAG: hypothetical protein M1831_003834 [Alyxoria varia]|nr:MAG: hypothetical protein M1831_003834 [Alyxoria varia]